MDDFSFQVQKLQRVLPRNAELPRLADGIGKFEELLS